MTKGQKWIPGDPALGEINGKWFMIALPRIPWWRNLWAKIYVRWCYFRGQPVITSWDMPDEWKNR